MGSWKIMAMREPRSWRMELTSKEARSRGSAFSVSTISPSTWACGGRRRMIANEVTDFPEPDSPTRPSTSPRAMERFRSRTAGRKEDERTAGFSLPGNPMLRLRICRSGGTASWYQPLKQSSFARPDSRGRLSLRGPSIDLESEGGRSLGFLLLLLSCSGFWPEFRWLRFLSTPAAKG